MASSMSSKEVKSRTTRLAWVLVSVTVRDSTICALANHQPHPLAPGGWTNSDTDYIAALPVGTWNRLGGSKSNGNVVCGHDLKISNGDKAITVKVVDQCPSCADNHVDLSPAAFEALGSKDKGVLPVSWGWVGAVPHQ